MGSLSDPAELPGLSHFLEHMLFYASERYPEEDEYSKFISEHGGGSNAYTAAESTNYHFSVKCAPRQGPAPHLSGHQMLICQATLASP